MKYWQSILRYVSLSLILLLSACGDGGSSGSNNNENVSLQAPNNFNFVYNQPQVVTATLPSNVTQININSTPANAASMLSYSFHYDSSNPTMPITLTNMNPDPQVENMLNSASYYITVTLSNGKTLTSNTISPTSLSLPSSPLWEMDINNITSANEYLFVYGQNLQASGAPHGVIEFTNNNGAYYGAFKTYSNSQAYGSDNNSIVLKPGINKIYIPYGVSEARAYVSNTKMIGLNLDSDGGITTYDASDSANPNYNTIYDYFEFTYANSRAVINQTAVDAVAVPICITGSKNYSPIQQAGFCNITRANLMSDIVNYFNTNISNPTLRAQWLSLILRDSNNNILRIISPGAAGALIPVKGSTIQPFANYLHPYIGALANYYHTPGSLNLVSPDGSQHLSGNIQNLNGVDTYVFNGGSMPLTTANLLQGVPPAGATPAVIAAYQMVSAAFMAGQLPSSSSVSPNGITEAFLQNQRGSFYSANSLYGAVSSQNSIYSEALNSILNNGVPNNTTTYFYDDVLGKRSTMTQVLASPAKNPDPITLTIRGQ